MTHESEKDRLAAEAMERWYDFQRVCRPKKKFPVREFRAFWPVAKRYAELTRTDKVIHRDLATAVHELTTVYGWASKTPEDGAIAEIQRLECLIFDGYDPHFEGDEPPEL
jgi:hypothetical protein